MQLIQDIVVNNPDKSTTTSASWNWNYLSINKFLKDPIALKNTKTKKIKKNKIEL